MDGVLRYRILVTGSRTWLNGEEIFNALDAELDKILTHAMPWHLTIVHGGAHGADTCAGNWVAQRATIWPVNIAIEVHRPNWVRHGKSAGILRNLDMIRLGADLCLAFIRDNSAGATQCAAQAHAAGIETRITRWEVRPLDASLGHHVRSNPSPRHPPIGGQAMQPGAPQNNNPFTNPNAPGAGSVAPKIYDLEGCLVAMQPTAFTAAGTADNLTGFEGSPPRDRVTANVILLETANGQPVTFGGDKTKGTPDTHYAAAPARFTGVWLNSQNIVAALAPGGQPQVGALILGRVRRSDVGRRPWNLVAVDGTPDMAKAIDIYNRITMGQLQYSEPVPMGGAPTPAPANSVSYGAPTTTAAPAQAVIAPVVDPYQQWLAQQQAVVAQKPVMMTPPPGWQESQWSTLNPLQQAEVYRSMGIPVPA